MTIVAQHLSFSYSGPLVLEDLCFEVSDQEIIAIIGPNGGGKTTLLSLIMGFVKPTNGTLKVEGGEIGWVPQHFQFDRDFPISVLDVVLGGRLSRLRWHGNFCREDRMVAHEVLDKVGMKKSAHSSFSELSGGQMQRVLIARALAGNPSLLLLDEPTSHVDAQTQKELYEMLSKLEMTILMVTHDFGQAVNCVQRVFCIEKKLSIFSPKEICEHFAMGLYH